MRYLVVAALLILTVTVSALIAIHRLSHSTGVGLSNKWRIFGLVAVIVVITMSILIYVVRIF